MVKKTVKQVVCETAPKAIGPYSQAVIAGSFLFVSGQIPVDSKTGKIVSGGIQKQSLKVIENLKAILSSGGLTLKDVVKTEVFLTDINDFQDMNQVYGEEFNHDARPARQVIEVCKLPKNARIEISCIAYLGE